MPAQQRFFFLLSFGKVIDWGKGVVKVAVSTSYFLVASYNDSTSNEVKYYCMKKEKKGVLAILANKSH